MATIGHEVIETSSDNLGIKGDPFWLIWLPMGEDLAKYFFTVACSGMQC